MLRRIQEADVDGKTVLVRVDYNVPMAEGKVADDGRIRASIPTITHLLDRGAKVALITHLGRPNGVVVDDLRVDPIADRLAELIGATVHKLDECIGERVGDALADGAPGDVFLLENVRFHPGEEANEAEFARQLAAPGEIYVNDAFGAVHRAHASTLGLATALPAFAGFLVQRELEALSHLLNDPDRPYVAVVGGKKAASKLGALRDLVARVDSVLIGGGVAFTFLHAHGVDVAASLVDEKVVPDVREIVRAADETGVELVLPSDVVAAQRLAADVETRVVEIDEIPEGWAGFDIGPETIQRFSDVIRGAKSLVWTGPMGAFEVAPFAEGTRGIADAIGAGSGYSVIGGGETGEAIARFGRADDVSYISTGGGACLAVLRGKSLPALDALYG